MSVLSLKFESEIPMVSGRLVMMLCEAFYDLENRNQIRLSLNRYYKRANSFQKGFLYREKQRAEDNGLHQNSLLY